MRGNLLVALRFAAMLLVVAVYFIPCYGSWLLGLHRLNLILVRQFYGWICCILSIRVRLHGAPSRTRPLIVMANHISYLDVMVLGSQAPLVFTPKIEIAKWPVIGLFCKISCCLFIDRRPSQTAENQARIREHLARGHCIVIFPESTTGNGLRVLPFHSSYFNLSVREHVPVQPVAIAYTKLYGLPAGFSEQSKLAWYGDMDFAPHFLDLMRQRRITADVYFLPILSPENFTDRKTLSIQTQKTIEQAITVIRGPAGPSQP